MSLLAIQPGAIGDVILSLPALRALRQTLGADRMEIWSGRALLPLLARPECADTVRALADTGIDSYPLPDRALATMREFDTVVSWRGARDSELSRTIKCAHPHAWFFPQFPATGERIHMCDFRRAQIRSLLAEHMAAGPEPYCVADAPHLVFDRDELLLAEGHLGERRAPDKPIVVIHPGASGKAKQWEPENFAAVAGVVRRFREHRSPRLLICRGPLDERPANALLEALDGQAEMLHISNLRSLAAALSRADLFIGNDTGITHLAAASDTSTLAIFLSSDPEVWAPRGKGVAVMLRPTVEQASDAACRLLDASLSIREEAARASLSEAPESN